MSEQDASKGAEPRTERLKRIVREARLRLMRRLERLILQLGDISEIVATES